MLKTDAVNLLAEIKTGESARDERLRATRDLLANYGHKAFSGGRSHASPLIHHSFEFVSLVVPRWSLMLPTVSVDLPGLDEAAESAVERAMQSWMRLTRFNQINLEVAFDTAFAWGCFLLTRERSPALDPSDPEGPWLPRLYRLSPQDVGFDYRARSFHTARLTWHRYVADKDALMRRAQVEEGWDIAAIERLASDSGQWYWLANTKDGGPPRDDVWVYEVWVPEHVLPHSPGPLYGFNGTLHTIAEGADGAVELRAPRPYFGPPTGPHYLVGIYIVPEDAYPLAPLVATLRQASEANAVEEAISQAIRDYKRLIFVDSKNPKLNEDIATKKNMYVVPMDDFDASGASQQEFGGITPQHIAQRNLMLDDLDRVSGMSDARRGSVTGASATESDIASRATTSREMYQQQRYFSGVEAALAGVAWYLINDPEARLPLRDGGLYVSGAGGAPVQNVIDISINVRSMEPQIGPVKQRNAMLALQLAGSIGQGMVAMPWVNWLRLAARIGDAYNDPEFAEQFDAEAAMALGGGTGQLGQIAGWGGVGGGAGRPIRNPANPDTQTDAMPGLVAGSERAAEVKTGKPNDAAV